MKKQKTNPKSVFVAGLVLVVILVGTIGLIQFINSGGLKPVFSVLGFGAEAKQTRLNWCEPGMKILEENLAYKELQAWNEQYCDLKVEFVRTIPKIRPEVLFTVMLPAGSRIPMMHYMDDLYSWKGLVFRSSEFSQGIKKLQIKPQ